MSPTPPPDGALPARVSPRPLDDWPGGPLRADAHVPIRALGALRQRTVYVDTEFTQLGPDALLLSVGMVTDTLRPDEFYGEVTDPDRLSAAGWFARAAVTPQFGKLPGTACSYAQLGVRIAVFLRGLLQIGPCDASARVVFESDSDWTLIVRAISQSCPSQWHDLALRLAPANVYNMAGFAAGERAAEAYFQSQSAAVISRHHALCDARALRIACRAAEADTRAIPQVIHPASARPPLARAAARARVPDTSA